MPTVTFLPTFRKVEVNREATILDAAQKAGINMNVVCGGQGKCGKCIVYVKSGWSVFDREQFIRFFSSEELEQGACLACQTTILDDLSVFIPESSLIQEQKILMEHLEQEIGFSPAVWKYFLELTPPSLDDPSPDLSRLLWGIHQKGGPEDQKIYVPQHPGDTPDDLQGDVDLLVLRPSLPVDTPEEP